MRLFLTVPAAVILFSVSAILCVEPENGVAAYKRADYNAAIPLLESAIAKDPKDPVTRAALLSALVFEGRVDEASDAAEADASLFPASPDVTAARGEFAFYMGDMLQAEKLFKASLKLGEQTARGYYGLYRLFKAASLYRTARLALLHAHEIDPDDALINGAWVQYLTPEKRKEVLGTFVTAHPWLFNDLGLNENTASDVNRELNGHKQFELDGAREQTTLNFVLLKDSPTSVRGVGLEFRIENSHLLRLLFDTGATGILLNQRAIDKAGLNHLGNFTAAGIGDKGAKAAFAAVAPTCQVGPLRYKSCLIQALEGKGRVGGEEDGLIGADFFSDYIVEIDFQKHVLQLTPLPAREPSPQGYDRVISPEEKTFTPVFRFGHHLYVLTVLNERNTGLFLIDTGSSLSAVDSTFARLSTKIHGDSYLRVKGISGDVKNVFEADKAVLQFATYRQRNLGLTCFNLNNSSDHQEVRMAGVLGLPVLAMFRLTLDYRNGLVNFDYIFKR